VRVFGNVTASLYSDRNFGGIRLAVARDIAVMRNILTRDNPN